MPTHKRKKRKKKTIGINLLPFIIIFGLLMLILSFYVGYRISISDRKLFSASILALFAGLLFESFRIASNWKVVAATLIGAYFFSFFALLPGKHENIYSFENHLTIWPYYLLGAFAFLNTIIHEEKVTTKLTEGVALLLSISFVYWVIDYNVIQFDSWIILSLLAIGVFLALFSTLHALTHIQLSRDSRLTLSIWGTIIMFAFAVDNIFRVFSNVEIEDAAYFSQGLYIGIQYFLLGVSAVYVIQNYILLAIFIPSKHGGYLRDLRDGFKLHIKRFSDEQVVISHSLLCIFYAGALYWINYMYHLLPRHTMIWLVIVSFPLVLKAFIWLEEKWIK